jgi:hypothetical protein
LLGGAFEQMQALAGSYEQVIIAVVLFSHVEVLPSVLCHLCIGDM